VPIHPFDPPRGRCETIVVDSRALGDNLLGDPARRSVVLYLPEDYERSDAEYPLFLVLAGYGGSGLRHAAWRAFGESLPQRIDRLVAQGRMGPVILAMPDGFTSLGGNQYINSPATGRWEDFLLEDLLPRIERDYRVGRGPAHRVIFGKSSGGYGAMVQALKHGGQWAAVACHSGDMGFDLLYRRDLPVMLDGLARHGGSPARFIEAMRAATKLRGTESHVLMLLAMAASYDPDPGAPFGVRLPVDPHTCTVLPERWQRWLEHDPLALIEHRDCQARLRGLKGLLLDCGSQDQYFLHYGARALVRRLEALGIDHRYEEFDDSHSGIDYRLDVSLPFLYRAALH
jgi:enterochelin esterase-like enzyme